MMLNNPKINKCRTDATSGDGLADHGSRQRSMRPDRFGGRGFDQKQGARMRRYIRVNRILYRDLSALVSPCAWHTLLSGSFMEKRAGTSRGDRRSLREGADREGRAWGQDADLTGNRETPQRVFRRVTAAQRPSKGSPTDAMSQVRLKCTIVSVTKNIVRKIIDKDESIDVSPIAVLRKAHRGIFFKRARKKKSPIYPESSSN